MNEQYKLNTATLKDIINNIPEEKWDEVFEEMSIAVKQIKGVMTLLKVTAEAMNMPITDIAQFPDEVTWVDDGKRENTVTFSDKDSGENVGELN